MKKFTTFIFLFSLLVACSVTTPQLTVNTTLPRTYGLDKTDSVNTRFGPWSLFYRDTCLIALIKIAVQNNFSSRLALERIKLADANYANAKSTLLPSLNASINGSVDRYGEYTMNGIGNDDTNRSESLPADKKLPSPYPELFASPTFSWAVIL